MKFFLKFPTGGPTTIVLALILYATLTPNPVEIDPEFMFPHMDKVIHFIMFFFLVWAMAFDTAKITKSTELPTLHLRLIVAAAFVVGMLTELLQSIMEAGRTGALDDLVADVIGALVAMITSRWIVRLLLPSYKEK